MVYNDNFNGYTWWLFFLTDEYFRYPQDDIENISIINLHSICYTNITKKETVSKRLCRWLIISLLHYSNIMLGMVLTEG